MHGAVSWSTLATLMKRLPEMLQPLAAAAIAEEARHANAWAMHGAACAVGRQLPLVHRTHKPGAPHALSELFKERRIAAQRACTERERRAGISRAAYLFLGSAAYPDGQVAFVLDRAALEGLPCSYSPMDSGALDKHIVPADPSTSWDDSAKDRCFQEHLGHGDDVAAFAGPFLATHFRDPLHYVTCPQESQPDFAPYHGLRNPGDDRRTFTIEVRAHEDVSFGPDENHLIEIVVSRMSFLEELPDDLVGKARAAEAENEVLEAVARGIGGRLGAQLGAGAA